MNVAPELDGAFDICSPESAILCKDECNARIELAPSLCATCLLEGASYGLDNGPGNDDLCDQSGSCTMTGRVGSCTYQMGDTAAKDACSQQVYPRREVSCEPSFAPVQDCAAICQA